MKKYLLQCGLLASLLIGFGLAGAANAGNNECPAGDPYDALDQDFGEGTLALTRCLSKRHHVKVVIQVNQFCRDAVPNDECTRSYALGNIQNMLIDYESIGMDLDKDIEIVAVVYGGGGALMIQDDVWPNQFQAQVEALMDHGVRFYLGLNTVRGLIAKGILTQGVATSQLIPGVRYATSGATAITDFQSRGYKYLQP